MEGGCWIRPWTDKEAAWEHALTVQTPSLDDLEKWQMEKLKRRKRIGRKGRKLS